MRRAILHVLTRPDDSLARATIDAQMADPGTTVQQVDLTQSPPDYAQLLQAIFEAESIQVW